MSDTNDYPDYASVTASSVRNSSYTEVWKTSLRGGLYDVRLVDESLLQFVESPGESFSFLDAPVRATSFEDFAAELLGTQWKEDVYRDLTIEVREEYEEYLASLDFERPATPIRYDHSPLQYRCSCHPVAHLHFGFSSEVRMATRRLWTPEAFAMFVIRQFFPVQWDSVMGSKDAKTICALLRENLEQVKEPYWNEHHEAEVYLV